MSQSATPTTRDNNNRHDDAQEYTLRSLFGEFYSRPMRSIFILVWAQALVFLGLAVFSAVRFFTTDQVKDLILYATGFTACMIVISLIKIFAWQMMNRNSVKREIKRLELRLAEIQEALPKPSP